MKGYTDLSLVAYRWSELLHYPRNTGSKQAPPSFRVFYTPLTLDRQHFPKLFLKKIYEYIIVVLKGYM